MPPVRIPNMKILKKLLLTALFVGLSVEQAPEAQSGCESCKVAVTDFLTEWAVLEPTLVAYLPAYLCKDSQLTEVCRQLVSRVLCHVTRALNDTSPEKACESLRWCGVTPRQEEKERGTLLRNIVTTTAHSASNSSTPSRLKKKWALASAEIACIPVRLLEK